MSQSMMNEKLRIIILDIINMNRKQIYNITFKFLKYGVNHYTPDLMEEFILKYSKNKYSFFLTEFYQFLSNKNQVSASKYLNIYLKRKIIKRETQHKQIKRIKKIRKDNYEDKKMRRFAQNKAQEQIESQKRERISTREKIKKFYGEIQKYK